MEHPENVRRMWPDPFYTAIYPEAFKGTTDHVVHRPNVWLLTSISDQATADVAIPELLKCRDLCPVLGVSYEPAMGPVEFAADWLYRLCPMCGRHGDYCDCDPHGEYADNARLDWIIVGGESGPHARPFNVAWARSTIEQCRAAGVPCFVKQLGARPCRRVMAEPIPSDIDAEFLALKDKKGGDIEEWPRSLRVRQFPSKEAIHANA